MMMSKAASPLQKALRRFTSGNPDKFFVEIISPLLSNFNCHPSTFILPQFRERGNSVFMGRISNLSDMREGRSKRCRLVLVHRWTSTIYSLGWCNAPTAGRSYITAPPTISRNDKTTLYAPTTRTIQGFARPTLSGPWYWKSWCRNICKGQSGM